MLSGCRRSTKVMNRERLIFPAGTRSTRTRAGAMGEKGSTAMVTSGVAMGLQRRQSWRSGINGGVVVTWRDKVWDPKARTAVEVRQQSQACWTLCSVQWRARKSGGEKSGW